jgi:hypothetical protein
LGNCLGLPAAVLILPHLSRSRFHVAAKSLKKMDLPDQEQAWIEKYREAMDAMAGKESRLSRIRTAWGHLISVVGSAPEAIAHRTSRLRASEPPACPSKPPAAETSESMNQPSALEQNQSGGNSPTDDAEYGAVAS